MFALRAASSLLETTSSQSPLSSRRAILIYYLFPLFLQRIASALVRLEALLLQAVFLVAAMFQLKRLLLLLLS
jgi:hypothetical protein